MSGRSLGSGIGRRTLIDYGSRGEVLDSVHDLLMTMFAFAPVSWRTPVCKSSATYTS